MVWFFGLGPGPISLAPVLQGAEGGFAEHLRATKPPFFCQKQGRAKPPEKEKKKKPQTAASAAAWKPSLSQKASPGFCSLPRASQPLPS